MAIALLQPKFESLEAAVNNDILERTREVDTAMIALVAGVHHFQIGPPGTAKSLLVRSISKRIGGLDYNMIDKMVNREVIVDTDASTGRDFRIEREVEIEYERLAKGYFQWLLTRYTTPEEIFGPPSLTALEHGRYERSTGNKLPEARIAFLDEIFKANSSILNALLTIMNERLFFNGANELYVPLSSLFAASNEMPQGDELGALWDRLHFRHEIKQMQDSGNFINMLAASRNPNPEPIITWNEIAVAQEQATTVSLPNDIFEAMKTLRDNLRKEGIEPTERRWVESLKIVRAAAWLNGRGTADIDDLRSLRHVMWTRLEDQRIVERAVLELANPIDREAHDLLERVEGLENDLRKAISDSDNSKAVAKQAVEIHGKLHKAKARMDELKTRCEENGRKSEVLDSLNAKFIQVAKVLMVEGFGIEGDPTI